MNAYEVIIIIRRGIFGLICLTIHKIYENNYVIEDCFDAFFKVFHTHENIEYSLWAYQN